MPIKIFSAPGDHRDDFGHVERQVNEWITAEHPKVRDIRVAVNELGIKRDVGQFMMTLVVHYEQG